MQAGQEVSPEPPEVEGETPAPGRWEARAAGERGADNPHLHPQGSRARTRLPQAPTAVLASSPPFLSPEALRSPPHRRTSSTTRSQT